MDESKTVDIDTRARVYALELLTTQLISEYLRAVPESAKQAAWAREHLYRITETIPVEGDGFDEEARLLLGDQRWRRPYSRRCFGAGANDPASSAFMGYRPAGRMTMCGRLRRGSGHDLIHQHQHWSTAPYLAAQFLSQRGDTAVSADNRRKFFPIGERLTDALDAHVADLVCAALCRDGPIDLDRSPTGGSNDLRGNANAVGTKVPLSQHGYTLSVVLAEV